MFASNTSFHALLGVMRAALGWRASQARAAVYTGLASHVDAFVRHVCHVCLIYAYVWYGVFGKDKKRRVFFSISKTAALTKIKIRIRT